MQHVNIVVGVVIAMCTAMWAIVVHKANPATFAATFVLLGLGGVIYLIEHGVGTVNAPLAFLMSGLLGGYQVGLYILFAVINGLHNQGLVNLNVLFLVVYDIFYNNVQYQMTTRVAFVIIGVASMYVAYKPTSTPSVDDLTPRP